MTRSASSAHRTDGESGGALRYRPDGGIDRCLTDEDLAQRFGASRGWVYRNIARLQREEGFPAPVSSIGRRRYDPRKVERWFQRDPSAPRPAAAISTQSVPDDDDDAAWRAALAAKYGRG